MVFTPIDTPVAVESHFVAVDLIQNIVQIVGNISIVLLAFVLIKLCLDKNKSNEADAKKAINKKIITIILIMIVIIVLTTLVSIVTHATQPLLYNMN